MGVIAVTSCACTVSIVCPSLMFSAYIQKKVDHMSFFTISCSLEHMQCRNVGTQAELNKYSKFQLWLGLQRRMLQTKVRDLGHLEMNIIKSGV